MEVFRCLLDVLGGAAGIALLGLLLYTWISKWSPNAIKEYAEEHVYSLRDHLKERLGSIRDELEIKSYTLKSLQSSIDMLTAQVEAVQAKQQEQESNKAAAPKKPRA